MKSYRDYREGKHDAYVDALFIVRKAMEEYEGENKLEFIQVQLEQLINWSREELERLDTKGATN